MGQCNICEQPTQSGLCQECRLEEYYGVPDDHWDDEEDQPKDPELRSDGSGWGTLVDRDGNPIESRPDLAGEHRDPSRKWDDGDRIDGRAANSKWPDVRQVVIAAVADATTGEIADRADCHPDTAAKWLAKAHDAGYIQPTGELLPRNQSEAWEIADVGADVLPEVLRV